MRSNAWLRPSRSVVIIAVFIAALGGVRVAVRAQNPIQPLAEQPLQRETLTPAPARAQGEGFGPYSTMVIRGAMLIDGTGGPPRGAGAILVQHKRVTAIPNPGTPGVALPPDPQP